MRKCKGLDFLGYFMIVCAAVILAYVRIDGIDLSEGRLLVDYWLAWAVFWLLCFSGAAIVCRPK